MGKNRTTTSEATPWGPAQGDLKRVLGEAGRLYDAGGMVQYAPMAPQTQAGIERMSAPSPITGMAEDTLTGYLDGSRFRDYRKVLGDDLQSRLGSMFSGGSTDNPLVQEYIARGMTEGLAGAEYNAGMQALGMAPTIAGMGRQDTADMMRAGGVAEMYGQRELDKDMLALQKYASIAGGMGGMGGSNSMTEPVSFGETLANIGKFAMGIGGFGGIPIGGSGSLFGGNSWGQ